MESEPSSEEIVHGHEEYTPEELLEQCQDNAASLLLATMSVLAERGVTVEEWAAGVARVFARAWEREEAWQPAFFLDALLTNLRALGATVKAADLDAEQATATIRDYPDPTLADALGVDAAFGAAMLHVAAHLAPLLGLALSWRRDEAAETITLAVTTPVADR